MVNIPVRVSLEERERYRAAAEALGVTLSNVAREAWEQMLERAERVTSGAGSEADE